MAAFFIVLNALCAILNFSVFFMYGNLFNFFVGILSLGTVFIVAAASDEL